MPMQETPQVQASICCVVARLLLVAPALVAPTLSAASAATGHAAQLGRQVRGGEGRRGKGDRGASESESGSFLEGELMLWTLACFPSVMGVQLVDFMVKMRGQRQGWLWP